MVDKQTKPYSLARVCLRFLPYSLGRWRGLLVILIVMLLGAGFNALKPWPMKILIDNVLYGKSMSPALADVIKVLPGATRPEILIGWVVGATLLIFCLEWALKLTNSYAGIGFGQRMVYDLAADVFNQLQRLSLNFHSRSPIGDSIRRVTSDCNCISTIISGALFPAAVSVISLVTMLAIMWHLDHRLTLLSISVVPVMLLILRRYARPMTERSYEQQEVEARMYNIVEQTLSSIPAVQAFGREKEAELRFQANANAIIGATLSSTSTQMQFKILTGLTTAIGTAVILWVGAQGVLSGQLTVGSIIVFLSYLGSLYGPLQSLMYSPSTVQGAAGSARRVMEVLEREPEVKDHPRARTIRRGRGLIRMQDVWFGYEAGRPVLRGVSLEAQPGETLAIVGETGAGKSTLVSLIPRFFDPWQGRVTMDGHDLRELRLKSLRRQVSVVLQEPFLFPTSIADNIAYGRPEATREEVEEAARTANAHEFIQGLEGGYDAVVGERGATLSGGERQRLAIARAVLKDSPVLILDEPTSALDAETEWALMEALERLMKGRTTFIIAHRLSTVRRAHRIVVLQNGIIAEAGTHDELMARNNLYALLNRRQFGNAAAANRGCR